MKKERRNIKSLTGVVMWLMITLGSCHTHKQASSEQMFIHHTDTLWQKQTRIDSILIHDSISTFIKGDTVMIERWHTAYKERLRIDTVERVKTEIQIQTQTESLTKEVNRLHWWQTALCWTGGIALGLVLLWTIIKFNHSKN